MIVTLTFTVAELAKAGIKVEVDGPKQFVDKCPACDGLCNTQVAIGFQRVWMRCALCKGMGRIAWRVEP
jgi:DnaJ-class molecular chaperone